MKERAVLRELAKRYLQSRAPATVADFTWWSGLAAGEARPAIEAATSRRFEKRRRRVLICCRHSTVAVCLRPSSFMADASSAHGGDPRRETP